MTTTQITCPQCGHRFHAEEALEKQLLGRLKQDFEAQIAKREATLKMQMKKQAQLIEQSAQIKARKATALELEALRKNVNEQEKENLKLKKQHIDLMQREKKLQSQQEQMQLEMEKQLLECQDDIEKKARLAEQQKVELKYREYEKQLSDQKKLIEEMQRKSEQGSMQMQGEVQELALEDILRREFPFDRIEPVAKGVRGADVIQSVVDSGQRDCGRIIFESKRTKAFASDWIGKLKADQREHSAELAVIVTAVLPTDMERFGERGGVWICRYEETAALVFVLRQMLLRTAAVRSAQENKGEKMEMLYAYLTGADFTQRVQAIVDGFTGLKNDMEKEKNAMQRIWKSREKQIENIIHNTIDMYGSVQGIAGSSVASIPALELAPNEES